MNRAIHRSDKELSDSVDYDSTKAHEEIKVSIICDAFNHEKYISKAIDSFLMQKTSFRYEVLVHDDASTDRTAEIIREYEKKYPEIIKPIYQKENQYSQHINIQLTYQTPRAKGKYFAFCEGDDFWNDPLKLQKQYEAMENHPEVDICSHKANLVNESGETVLQEISPRETECVIPLEDVIMGEGGFVATNTLMYRKNLNQHIPNFRKFLPLDYTLQIHGSIRGGMYYLPDNMSSYRYMATGSWTSRMEQNRSLSHEFYIKKQRMLEYLDSDTAGQYSATIRKRQLNNEFNELLYNESYREVLSTKFKPFMKALPTKERLKVMLKCYFPHIFRLLKKQTRKDE